MGAVRSWRAVRSGVPSDLGPSDLCHPICAVRSGAVRSVPSDSVAVRSVPSDLGPSDLCRPICAVRSRGRPICGPMGGPSDLRAVRSDLCRPILGRTARPVRSGGGRRGPSDRLSDLIGQHVRLYSRPPRADGSLFPPYSLDCESS